MFQQFKTKLAEQKVDSPKETAEFKKLSPSEKMAVKDIYTMIGKTKGDIISKIDDIIKQVAKKRRINVSSIEKYIDNETIK